MWVCWVSPKQVDEIKVDSSSLDPSHHSSSILSHPCFLPPPTSSFSLPFSSPPSSPFLSTSPPLSLRSSLSLPSSLPPLLSPSLPFSLPPSLPSSFPPSSLLSPSSHTQFDSGRAVFSGEYTTEEIVNFVLTEQLPLVTKFSDEVRCFTYPLCIFVYSCIQLYSIVYYRLKSSSHM